MQRAATKLAAWMLLAALLAPAGSAAGTIHAALPAPRRLECNVERSAVPFGSNPGLRSTGGSADPADDQRWSDEFSLPVLDERVAAFTVYHGELVVAGQFLMAGGHAAGHVAIWHDGAWQPLGAGLDAPVYALAVYHDQIVAGGQFTTSGGATVGCISSWDGARWNSVGAPVGGYGGATVRTLAVVGSNLVAGGSFSHLGYRDSLGVVDVPAACIASWDGSRWTALGAGFDDEVDALAVLDDTLVAGGVFQNSGTNPACCVARWDGESWSGLGPGLTTSVRGGASALAVLRDTLYAGGAFPTGALVRWVGGTWQALPGSPEERCTALLADGDSLVAGGAFTSSSIQSWRAEARTPIGFVSWPEPLALVRFDSRLFAGGLLHPYGADAYSISSHVAAWDGSHWSALETVAPGDHGLVGYVAALDTMGSDVVAAGSAWFHRDSAWSPPEWAIRWDGAQWQPLSGSLTGWASALEAWHGTLVAAGNFWRADIGSVDVVAWNGSDWQPLRNQPRGARCLAVMRDTLYVGDDSGVSAFDGSNWRALPASAQSPYVGCLAVHRGQLYVGGQFDSLGAAAARNVACWDGATWHALGEGANWPVTALLGTDSVLVVGGMFDLVGGQQAYGLATWDGTRWHAFPDLLAEATYSIVATRGSLYVSAYTLAVNTDQGYVDCSGIARWDGVAWHALGSGTNGRAIALLARGNDLFVGGDQSLAGGHAAFGFSRWALDSAAAPVTPPAGLAPRWRTVAPNPFTTSGTHLEFALAQRAIVRLTVHDVTGREVARLASGPMEAGSHAIVWTGIDARGSRLCSGVYFAKLAVAGSPAACRRLVFVR